MWANSFTRNTLQTKWGKVLSQAPNSSTHICRFNLKQLQDKYIMYTRNVLYSQDAQQNQWYQMRCPQNTAAWPSPFQGLWSQQEAVHPEQLPLPAELPKTTGTSTVGPVYIQADDGTRQDIKPTILEKRICLF